MPYRIVSATWLAPLVRRLEVEAPLVAARHRPGHFVIVRGTPDGERIPLTVAASDPRAGTITLVIQLAGATTERMGALGEGDALTDVVGPLGRPTEIERFGHVVLVGGGVGTAVIYPQAAALKALGNRVTAIIGGRSRPYVILEAELGAICDAVHPCTDDGSHGFHGFVTQRLAQVLAAAPPVNTVITAGPVGMMKAIAELTRGAGVRAIASLNPVMVDGTGMCGGCRVTVGGETRFACVDGPEFDAHQVAFDELTDRLSAYRDHEQRARARLAQDRDHACRLAIAKNGPSAPPELGAERAEVA